MAWEGLDAPSKRGVVDSREGRGPSGIAFVIGRFQALRRFFFFD
jgi:hypothetical protein